MEKMEINEPQKEDTFFVNKNLWEIMLTLVF